MHRLWMICRALLILFSTVLCLPPEDVSVNVPAAQWDVDVPASITVKKSSRSANVETAIVLTEEQKDAITAKHNALREIAEPTATNMRKMSWDDELADLATSYSRKCIYEHNPDRTHSRFSYIGENLYISVGIEMHTSLLTNAVFAWDNEKKDYNYETRHCIPGKKCGHYTQIVWDDTFKVGCGVTICYKVQVRGKVWEHATLFACNYGPGGNYDRHPFVAGPSCSGCSADDACEDNLCANPVRDQPFSSSKVPASWNEWSPWSACSKTCIGGSAKRERTCSTFVPKDCSGSAWEMTFTCSQNLCDLVKAPGGGDQTNFLPWGPWSGCSTTCGMGIVMKQRKCKPGGRCSGIHMLRSSCNKGDCRDFEPSATGWASWGPWQACSVTCGDGIQKRKRSCTESSTCKGKKENKKRCRVVPCSIPAARWSAWSRWSSCTATCGGGSRTKKRKCLTGSNCEGAETDSEVCNDNRCPGKFSPWSNWEGCSTTCGTGLKTRTRHCIGGTDCVGSAADNRRCSIMKCPEHGPWGQWSDCDVTCGSGNRIRKRICSSPDEDDCEGESTSAIPCSMVACTTSGWSPWSPWTKCSVSCGGGKKSTNRLCNIGNSGPSACDGLSVRRKGCKMNKCPVFTAWSEWSSCDTTCGEGTKTRFRTCDTLTGDGCEGPRNEVSECKLVDCEKSKWKSWSAWSACSVSCGTGKRTRSRDCNLGNTGPPCIGQNDEVKVCSMESCISTKTTEEKDPPNKGPNERNGQSGTGSDKKAGGGAAEITSQKLLIIALTVAVTFLTSIS